MFRVLIAIPALLIVGLVVGLYVAYGAVEPCHALAVERARRLVGHETSGLVEPFTRIETSQMSTGQCARGLWRSWMSRLEDKVS